MNKEEILTLRRQSHSLKPVVMIGSNGLTKAVHAEIEVALEAHELIKIRISANDKDEFKGMANQICEEHRAALIKTIGHIAVIYRAREKTD